MGLALIASAPALAQDQAERVAAGSAAKDCIRAAAEKFEPSGEPADDIATATFGHCDQQISALRATSESLAAELLPRLRNMAVARVVEIRAARRGH
jgi:hypothetical protein